MYLPHAHGICLGFIHLLDYQMLIEYLPGYLYERVQESYERTYPADCRCTDGPNNFEYDMCETSAICSRARIPTLQSNGNYLPILAQPSTNAASLVMNTAIEVGSLRTSSRLVLATLNLSQESLGVLRTEHPGHHSHNFTQYGATGIDYSPRSTVGASNSSSHLIRTQLSDQIHL
jgi:hypothetical protein